MIRDGVSAGYVKQTEFLIAKYASESKLNKRNGNKVIAMATRADFNPHEIRTDIIRQIEWWVAPSGDRAHLNIMNIHKYHEYSRQF